MRRVPRVGLQQRLSLRTLGMFGRLNVLGTAALVGLGSSPLLAQLQTMEINGRVLSPGDTPVTAARVVVMDRLGAVVASVVSGDDGRFVFRHLSSGDYWLRAETDSMRSPLELLSARAGPPARLTLRLVPRAHETVEVAAS